MILNKKSKKKSLKGSTISLKGRYVRSNKKQAETEMKKFVSNGFIKKATKIKKSRWLGNWYDIFFGILYLVSKYKDVCFPITNFDKTNSYLKNICISFDCVNKDNCREYKIEFPGGQKSFYKNCLNCINKKKKFIIIPLLLRWNDGVSAHANILIIDIKNESIERFEPYGKYVGNDNNSEYLVQLEFDNRFRSLNKKNIFKNYKYYSPFQYCPIIGFQKKEENNIQLKKGTAKINLGDPGGFCASWILWYANLRFEYPNLKREKLIEKGKKIILKNKSSFRTFIRNYSEFINKKRSEILKNMVNDVDSSPDIFDYYEYESIISKNIISLLKKQFF